MKKYSKMVELNKEGSREKIDRAIQAIWAMVNQKEQVRICDLVEKTGLSRAFFYKNEEVRKAVIDAKEKQAGKVFEQKKKMIFDKVMEGQILVYERQIESLRSENEALKKENEKLGKMLKKKELNFINGL